MLNRTVKISKFLSLVLRHKPETIGLSLDEAGWVSVSELLEACESHDFSISLEELQTVVTNNDKKRFAFSPDETLIRASQGHSLTIDLATATKVGARRGRPVILTVKSGQMYRDGYRFFQSANGVWLTEHVPASYLSKLESAGNE